MKIIKKFDLEDVFTMSEIIDKMGIEADIEKLTKSVKVEEVEKGEDVAKLGKEVVLTLGVDLITKIIRNLHRARTEVKQLISSLTGMSESEVSKMDLKQMKQFFMSLLKEDGVKDFLSQAGE